MTISFGSRRTRVELSEVAEDILSGRLPGRPEQGIRVASAVQNYALGAKKTFGFGAEIFRYGQAGAADCNLGELQQSALLAAEIDLVPLAAYVIGTKVIGITTVGAINANEYAGGWIWVNAGTDIGECLRILSHPAAGGGAPCLFTCLDGLTAAFVVANTVCSLMRNPYAGVIIHPAPPTTHLVGVPRVTIPTTQFGWFQRKGPAAVLIDAAPSAAPVVNDLVQAGAVTNGSVMQYDFLTGLGVVGEVIRTDAVELVAMVNLMLE